MYDGGDGGYTGPGPGYTIVSRGVSMIATCKPSTEHHTYTISRGILWGNKDLIVRQNISVLL